MKSIKIVNKKFCILKADTNEAEHGFDANNLFIEIDLCPGALKMFEDFKKLENINLHENFWWMIYTFPFMEVYETTEEGNQYVTKELKGADFLMKVMSTGVQFMVNFDNTETGQQTNEIWTEVLAIDFYTQNPEQ